MSWMKFWKSSKKDKESRSDAARSGSFRDDMYYPNQNEAEKDRNAKLRHTMSISRSGRFKQKKKERSGILDQPEFYNGCAPQNPRSNDTQKENRSSASNKVPENPERYEYARPQQQHSRSPPSTCRDATGQIPQMVARYDHTTVL